MPLARRPSLTVAITQLALAIPAWGCATTQRPTGSAQACGAEAWTPPARLISARGKPLYIETPSTVVLPGGTAMFGYPTFEWATPDVFQSGMLAAGVFAGVWVPKSGNPSPIPMPPGVSVGAQDPRAVPLDNGIAEVFWGSAPTTSPAPSVTRIAYARFDGNAWTTPQTLVQATSLGWADGLYDVLRAGGVTYIAIPGYTTLEGRAVHGIATVRIASDTPTVSWRHLNTSVANVVLIGSDVGQKVMAFIATLDRPDGRRYGVFSAPVNDAEDTTGTLLVKKVGPDTTAMWLKSVRIANAFHLLWIEQAKGTRDSRIMHASSSDQGKTWAVGLPMVLPGGTNLFEVATIGESIVVALQEPTSGLLQVVTSRDGWMPLHRPFAEPAFTGARFAVLGPDSLGINWGVGSPGAIPYAPQFPAPSQRSSVLRRHCPTRLPDSSTILREPIQ